MVLNVTLEYIQSELRCLIMRVKNGIVDFDEEERNRIIEVLLEARNNIGNDFVTDEKFEQLCNGSQNASKQSRGSKEPQRIIDYLNKVRGTRYRLTDKYRILIKTRFTEGFTYEDFITVIDKKILDWEGTEFEKYLQPTTLFSNKFDGYLNQSVKNSKPKSKKSAIFDLLRGYKDEEGQGHRNISPVGTDIPE